MAEVEDRADGEDFQRCAQCGRRLSSPDEACDHGKAKSQEDDDGKTPKSHMALAVVATLLVCPPFGLIAVIYAVKVASALKYGDVKAARNYSGNAGFWLIMSIVPYAIVIVLSVLKKLADL